MNRSKENKEKSKKQTQQSSCSNHLNKGTEDIREQNTKAAEINKIYKVTVTHCYPPTVTHPHPNINQLFHPP